MASINIPKTDKASRMAIQKLSARTFGNLTPNSLIYYTDGRFAALGAATNGQLPIGNTGNAPSLATLTAGNGITITNGAGSITITATPMAYKYIKATAQSEGDLHLSDGTNWAISKALIKYIRVITSSSDWDLYILQNDNSYATNDATIPAMQIGDNISGNATLFLDLPYQDEDASNEVHLYWLDNSGANTATIIIQGYSLS